MAAMWGIAVAGRIKANGENNRREVQRAGAHEQMVVFDSDRPIRCKTDFDAGSDRAAPAGFSYPVNGEAYSGCETLILVVGDGTAALHIPEHVIPGIADLAGEQAQRIDGGSVAQRGPIKQADIRSTQIGPIALCFQTEHHRAAHPTVADLAAGDRAGRVVTTLSDAKTKRNPEDGRFTPALVAPAAAGVGTDVEAAPVIDRSDDRRRFGVGAGREISCGSGRSQAQCNQSDCAQQKILHYNFSPALFVSLRPGASSRATAATPQLCFNIFRFNRKCCAPNDTLANRGCVLDRIFCPSVFKSSHGANQSRRKQKGRRNAGLCYFEILSSGEDQYFEDQYFEDQYFEDQYLAMIGPPQR